jgi:hypothetical protein
VVLGVEWPWSSSSASSDIDGRGYGIARTFFVTQMSWKSSVKRDTKHKMNAPPSYFPSGPTLARDPSDGGLFRFKIR